MRKNKYNAKKVVIDGIVFDSVKEYQTSLVRKEELSKGEIEDLVLQPEFKFELNGVLICTYFADFKYMRDGELVVEDVKSEITRKNPVYRIKYKLMKAFYGIKIKET